MLLAHGTEMPLPSAASIAGSLAVAAALYAVAMRRVWPNPRSSAAAGWVALVALGAVLLPPIETWAHRSLVGHMVQHLLLTSVVAPLLAFAAPVRLLLYSVGHRARRRLAQVIPSWFGRVMAHPATAWSLYTGVLWGAHSPPFYEAALDHPALHALEHGLFLLAAYVLWTQVVARDPLPRRLSYPGRAGLLVAALPPQSFLGVAIYSAGDVLYPHYGTGAAASADQQAGALVMWLGGDAIFLAGIIAVLALWVRNERDAADGEARTG